MNIKVFEFTDKTAKEAEALANKLGYKDSFTYATYDTGFNSYPMLHCIPDANMHNTQYKNGLSGHYIFSTELGVIAIQEKAEA